MLNCLVFLDKRIRHIDVKPRSRQQHVTGSEMDNHLCVNGTPECKQEFHHIVNCMKSTIISAFHQYPTPSNDTVYSHNILSIYVTTSLPQFQTSVHMRTASVDRPTSCGCIGELDCPLLPRLDAGPPSQRPAQFWHRPFLAAKVYGVASIFGAPMVQNVRISQE